MFCSVYTHVNLDVRLTNWHYTWVNRYWVSMYVLMEFQINHKVGGWESSHFYFKSYWSSKGEAVPISIQLYNLSAKSHSDVQYTENLWSIHHYVMRLTELVDMRELSVDFVLVEFPGRWTQGVSAPPPGRQGEEEYSIFYTMFELHNVRVSNLPKGLRKESWGKREKELKIVKRVEERSQGL